MLKRGGRTLGSSRSHPREQPHHREGSASPLRPEACSTTAYDAMDQNTRTLIDRFKQGNRMALSKLITLIESDSLAGAEVLSALDDGDGRESCVIGVTGPPGAGKSTLLNRIISYLRRRGHRVGVVAIDPSSPFTGGAMLGDRIRMIGHSADEGVFIRSLGTRGVTGGLSAATRDTISLYRAFGMDYVLVETVGVGQTELDVVEHADTVVVVLVPEAGDSIQAMKAGLMEIGDVFVVNKSDRLGAKKLATEIEQTAIAPRREGEWRPRVVLTQAVEGRGIEELMEAVHEHRNWLRESSTLAARRGERRMAELEEIVKELAYDRLVTSCPEEKKADVEAIIEGVRRGEIPPYEGAAAICRLFFT